MTFTEACARLGVTEEQVNDAIAQQGVVEIGLTCCYIFPSQIHGNGLYAAQHFAQSDYIIPVRLNGVITHLGAASNHGPANAVLVRYPNGNLYLQATRDIDVGEEILHDYTVCIWNTKEEPAL